MVSGKTAGTVVLALILIETDCGLKSFLESLLPTAGRGLTDRAYRWGRAIYPFLVLILLSVVFRWTPWLVGIAAAGTIMAASDRLLWQLQRRLFTWTGSRFRPLQVLQMAGLTGLAGAVAQAVNLAPSRIMEAIWREPFLLYLAGFVFLAHPANYLIRWFLDKEGDAFLVEAPGNSKEAAPLRVARAECAAGAGEGGGRGASEALRAGRVIGILERWTLLTLVLLSQYGALGLVLTAKSVARFKEMEKSSEFAEYYLLGTLYSTLSALVVGVALAAL